MPLIAQICMVIVTIALAGVSAMAIRLMVQSHELIRTANRSLAEVPALIEEARRTSARADELLVAFSQVARSARAAVSPFEALATRSTAMATTLLDEVERPIRDTVGVIQGIRAGVNHLIRGWTSSAANPSRNSQEEAHVGE